MRAAYKPLVVASTYLLLDNTFSLPAYGEKGAQRRIAPAPSYVVQTGDTLQRISRKTGISPPEIKLCNPHARFQGGETIQLYEQYTVKQNESLSRIAFRNGTTLAEIVSYNPSVGDVDEIIAGQKIAMPCREDREERRERSGLEKVMDNESEAEISRAKTKKAGQNRQKKPLRTIKYPNLQLAVAHDAKLTNPDGYFADPRQDGAPLVAIPRKDLFRRVSPHFLVAELVRVEKPDCLPNNGDRKRYTHHVGGDFYFAYARIDPVFVRDVEKLRTAYHKPFTFDEGYRPPEYNACVDGKARSLHVSGKAADILMPISDKKFAKLADRVFRRGGVGVGPTTTHVDNRGRRARWRY